MPQPFRRMAPLAGLLLIQPLSGDGAEDAQDTVRREEDILPLLGRSDLLPPKVMDSEKVTEESTKPDDVDEPVPPAEKSEEGESPTTEDGLPVDGSEVEAGGAGVLRSISAGEGPGSVEGTVFGGDGNGVAGVLVTLPDQGGFETTTDQNGNFRVTGLPAAGVTVQLLKPGYLEKVDVMQVREEGATVIRFPLELKPVELADGEYLIDTEEVILDPVDDGFGGIDVGSAETPGFVSGIGKEDFAKQNVSNAADAIGKVTGANIVGGRYAVIRGLADRYVSTTVNGALISSADPSRKAVQLDLFPTTAVEGIDVYKKYSPDLPGDFGGGAIDIRFLRFPNERLINFSYKLGYEDNLDGVEFFAHPDRELGFFGDVNNPLPRNLFFEDPSAETPVFIGGNANSPDPQAEEAWTNILDRQQLLPRLSNPRPSESFNTAFGDTWDLGSGRKLGFLMSFQRKTEDTVNLNAVRGLPSPERTWIQDDYTRSVEWGMLTSGGLQLAEGHKIGVSYFKKRIASDNMTNGRNIFFLEDGWTWGSVQSDDDFVEQYGAAAYQSGDFWRVDPVIRELELFQIDGSHQFGERGFKVDWAYTDATSTESRPQSSTFNRSVLDFGSPVLVEQRDQALRLLDSEQAPSFAAQILSNPNRFGDIIPNIGDPNTITWNELRAAITGNALAERLAGRRESQVGLIPVDTSLGKVFLLSNAEVDPANSLMFTNILSQEIEETTDERRFSFEFPFFFDDDSDDRRLVLSSGFRNLSKTRRSRGISANLQFNLIAIEDADRQSPDFLPSLTELLAADPTLISDLITGQREGLPFFTNGLTFEARNFDGFSDLDAHYFKANLFWDEWWFEGGVRYEEEERSYFLLPDPLNVLSPADRETGARGEVYQDALLPSFSFGRSFQDEKYKIDFAWSQTVARPTFFEFIPAFTVDQASQARRRGNFFLEQSEIENFDFGFEYLADEKNLLRFGLFHKQIENPIVEIFQEDAAVTVFDNGETAEISGIELEWLHSPGGAWSISGNYTFIDATLNYFVSRSGIDDRELLETRFPFQPEHIFNLNLGYDHEESGWGANLIYNYTGGYPVLLRSSVGGGDIVQNEQHSLDFVLRKTMSESWGELTIRAGIENLLRTQQTLTFDGGIFDGRQSDTTADGRRFFVSAGISF